MVDEVINTDPTPVTSPTPVEVVPTPESPAIETSVVAPVETPATETPAEPAQTEVTPEAKKPDTLLGGEKKAEEKPAEVKVETKAEEKPAEVKEAEVVAPTYEWSLPEGVTLEDAKIGEFNKTLAEFETTSKVPHDEMKKFGQQMVERHIQELQRHNDSLIQAWNKQKNDWKDSFLKSPEFANRTDTVLNSAIDAINVYGGDTKQQQEFRELMESTGVGNHPAMIRMLSNIMLAKAEPKPLAAPQIASGAKMSKISKMYGAKK